MSENKETPNLATDAVFVHSEPVPDDAVPVTGIDFDKPENKNTRAADLVSAMGGMGFQATSLGQACNIIDEMRTWEGTDKEGNPAKTTIFLGYTSNLISSGLRSISSSR